MDPYVVLGVRREATELEVRRAYRQLVRSLHPDVQPAHLRDRSAERLKVVNAARAEVLEQIRERPLAAEPRQDAPVVPPQRRPVDGDIDEQGRWAARQAWVAEQRRQQDAWSSARTAREQQRGRVLRAGLRPRRGASRALVPLVLLLLVQVVVALGVVRGVEAAGALMSVPSPSAPAEQMDLQELLARWGAWRS